MRIQHSYNHNYRNPFPNYKSESNLSARILEGERPDLSNNCGEWEKQLLTKYLEKNNNICLYSMWCKSLDNRWSIDRIIQFITEKENDIPNKTLLTQAKV